MATLAQAKATFQSLLGDETSAVGLAQNNQSKAKWTTSAYYWRQAGKAASDIHLNAYNYENAHPNENPQTEALDPALGDWNGQALRAQSRAIGYLSLAQADDDKAAAAGQDKPKPGPFTGLGPGQGRPITKVDSTTGEVVEVDEETGEVIQQQPFLESPAGMIGLLAVGAAAVWLALRYLGKK